MFQYDRRQRPRTRVTRFLRSVRIGVAAALLAAAPGCAGSSGTAGPDPNTAPRTGGNITLLVPGESRGPNPYMANLATLGDGSRLSALYDVLVWTDPATGTVRPQMAESLLPDSQALVWTLKLKDGIKFTDGLALDAAAVKKAWEKFLDPKVQSTATATVRQLGLTVVDRLTLSIKLPSPNANFDRAVADILNYVPSPRTLESEAALAASRTSPVGAGPYRLREWVPNSHMVLERNPDYWQPGQPYLDTVTIRVSEDAAKAAEEVDDGDADLVVTSDALAAVQAGKRGLSVTDVPLNGGQMVVFNTRAKSPLADSRLRRAISLSLSTEEMDRLHFGGEGRPAKGIFDSSTRLANGQLGMPENNPGEAAALFAQATEGGRKPLALMFMVPDIPLPVKTARYVKERVEAVSQGAVTIDVRPMPIPEFSKRVLIDTDFDLAGYVLFAEDPEPALFQFLHSKSGLSNLAGYQNPKVDAALEAARLSPDRVVRSAAYTRLQVELSNNSPFFVYQESAVTVITDGNLAGVQVFNFGHILWDRIGLRR